MKLLILLSSIISFSSLAIECGQFQTKYINEGKEVLTKEELCIRNLLFHYYIEIS